MYLLEIDEIIEHNECDWVETRCLCVSESREKLQDLANKIKEESIEYSKVERDIRYSKCFKDSEKHDMLMVSHKTFKHLSEYQVFREIDNSENKLSIIEIKVI